MMTTNDVAEELLVSINTVNAWVTNGLIVPAESQGEGRGNGHGNGHRYSLPQVVALKYANSLRLHGGGGEMVREAIAILGALSEEELKERIDRGERVYCPVYGWMPPVPAGTHVPPEFDLRELYQIVSERFAHLAKVRAESAKAKK